MRVLGITPYYTPEGGGLERYAHEIFHRLGEQGDDVRVLTFTREGHPDGTLDGVQVQRRSPWFSLGNAPINPAFPRHVAEQIDAFTPDVILAHTPVPFPAAAAFYASRGSDVSFVLTYHAGRLRGSSLALDLLASAYRSSIERWMLDESDRLIAVGPFVRENALAEHRDRVTLVPPGVDTRTFHPDGASAPGKEILFVGPLSSSYAWKGVDTLWRAFRRIHDRVPSASLKIVGEGDRLAEFEEKAQREGLPVELVGRVPEPDLVGAYREAGVVVLPSTSDAESFGMVLAEANACGRPVVASRVGGIPDFVRHGDNGLLVPPGDPDRLADGVSELLLDPERAEAMGARGHERVRKRHDWDPLASRTRAVLQETVQG